MKPEQVGKDRWRIRVYAGTDPATGRQIQRSRTYRAKGIREATTKGRQVAAELTAERDEDRKQYGTVGDIARRWLEAGERRGDWSPTTAARYRKLVRDIRADIGHHRADRLTALHVDEWFGVLAARGLSPRTIQHYRTALHTIMEQGRVWKLTPDTYAVKDSRPPRNPDREISPPTDDVVRLLVDTAPGLLRQALAVAAATGCRRGEIVGLRWSDLDGYELTIRRSVVEVPGQPITVKAPKSGRVRRMTVPPALVDVLEPLRARQASSMAQVGYHPDDWFVFPDLRDDPSGQTPLRPGWLSQAWNRHRRRHGADKVRLHDVRHWHATMLVSAGVPMTAVSQRLGHRNVSTTSDIYAHAVKLDDERAAGLVGGRLGLPSAETPAP